MGAQHSATIKQGIQLHECPPEEEGQALEPYEKTAIKAYNNKFIKALFNCQQKLKEVDEMSQKVSTNLRLELCKEATGYVLVALKIAKENATKKWKKEENKTVALKWKHWIAHTPWSIGCLKSIDLRLQDLLSELESMRIPGDEGNDGEEEILNFRQNIARKVDRNYDLIQSLDFKISSKEWSVVEKQAYDTSLLEIQRTLRIVRGKNTKILMDQLARQLRDMLQKLHDFKGAQENLQSVEVMEESYKLLCDRKHQCEFLKEIKKKMERAAYFNPESSINQLLDKNVEFSIKLCSEYEEMTTIERAIEQLKHVADNIVEEAKKSFDSSRWHDFWSTFATLCKCIAWPVIAPILFVRDCVNSTQEFSEYNKSISDVVSKNPWTFTMMALGTVGLLATGGYFYIPAFSTFLLGSHIAIGATIAGSTISGIACYHLAKEELIRDKKKEQEKAMIEYENLRETKSQKVNESVQQFGEYSNATHSLNKKLADEFTRFKADRTKQSRGNTVVLPSSSNNTRANQSRGSSLREEHVPLLSSSGNSSSTHQVDGTKIKEEIEQKVSFHFSSSLECAYCNFLSLRIIDSNA